MNNDYKDLIQDIILEEVDAEVINEAWWDRVKAKLSGAAAYAGQASTNLKNKGAGAWKGLKAGWSNKSVDDDIKAAHATDGSEKEAYKTKKIASWKKSLTSKIYKIEQELIKQAQNFVSEVYDDAKKLGLSEEDICHALKNYGGINRRFQYKGSLGDIRIFDDYAHHPPEIAASISAARQVAHDRLVVIFQPHTYTRTHAFLKEFAEALSKADLVVLADIYAAREVNTLGISTKDLQKEILKLNKNCEYFSSFDKIENFLLENSINGDMLITMGAGDVVNIGEKLLGL